MPGRSLWPKILPVFVLLAFLPILFTAVYYKKIIRGRAEETAGGYREIKISTQAQTESFSLLNRIITTEQESLQPIITRGVWEGKRLKVVPADRFFTDQYDYFRDYGIRTIKTVKDGRVFFGGLNAFAIKQPDDLNWEHLQLVEIPQEFSMDGNVIENIAETSQEQSDIYLKGLFGLLRLKPEGTLEEILSPFDPERGGRRHLKYLEGIVPYGENGLVAWRDYEVYYIEGETIRKWLTPQPDPSTASDKIIVMFRDLTEGDTTTLYGVVYGCTATSGRCLYGPWEYYLYKFKFSADPSVPLESTKLQKIINSTDNVTNQMKKVSVYKRKDDPAKKMVLGTATGEIIAVIEDFDMNLKRLFLEGEFIPGPFGYGQFKDSVVEVNQESYDFWLASETIGAYHITGFGSGREPEYKWMQTSTERNLLANTYPISIEIDKSKNILMGHSYLGPPQSSYLLTIFEPDIISPTSTPSPTPSSTPTPTITPTPTPTPTPAPQNSPPTITTTTLPEGKVGRYYQAEIRGGDADFADSLTINIRFLPRGLSKKECQNVKRRGINSISCKIEGRPRVATGSNYNITVLVSDGKATTSKRLKLRIRS